MKYLILITVFLMACDMLIEEAKPPKFTTTYFDNLEDANAALAAYEVDFQRLRSQCEVASPVDVERPKSEMDYLGQCLYSMGKIYGNKFPSKNNGTTRSEFLFECLKTYPESQEDHCCYLRDVAEARLKEQEAEQHTISNKCLDWCNMLEDKGLIGNYENCGCY